MHGACGASNRRHTGCRRVTITSAMAAVSPMLRPTTRHSTTSSFPVTRSGWNPSTSLRCSGHGADRFTLTRGITAGHVPTGVRGARRSRSVAGAGASASTAGTIPGTIPGTTRGGGRAGGRAGGPDGTADTTGHTGRIITASTAAGALRATCRGAWLPEAGTAEPPIRVTGTVRPLRAGATRAAAGRITRAADATTATVRFTTAAATAITTITPGTTTRGITTATTATRGVRPTTAGRAAAVTTAAAASAGRAAVRRGAVTAVAAGRAAAVRRVEAAVTAGVSQR